MYVVLMIMEPQSWSKQNKKITFKENASDYCLENAEIASELHEISVDNAKAVEYKHNLSKKLFDIEKTKNLIL